MSRLRPFARSGSRGRSTRALAVRPSDGAHHGFTIIELIAVMGIMAILFGISAATLAKLGKGPALDVAERQVRAAISRSRTAAREQSALAELVFENDGEGQGVIRTRITRDAGSWHFEPGPGGKDAGLGGRNNKARLGGAEIVPEGKVRSCARLDGGDQIKCGKAVGYDPTIGFDLSMDIKPDADADGGTLASFGDVFSFELGEDGELLATLLLEGEGEAVSLKTENGVVAFGVWCRVRLTFDGIDARLYAHNVMEAEKRLIKPQNPRARRLERPDRGDQLTFGGKSYDGLMDEVIYRVVDEEEPVLLADGRSPASFDQKGRLRVRFDREGRLDRRVHDTAIVVKMKDDEGSTRTVRVDMTGLFR